MIGLTGGIGSGKSTVARLLTERGALVIDADALAREVVEPGTPGLAAVRARFGAGVVRADGSLDRPALGAVVFADPAARRDLEGITHPLIRARTREIVAAAPEGTVVVHDIPLLVETGVEAHYHLVVAVDVDSEERVRRLVASRGMAEDDARRRIAQQASRAQRLAVADVVIDNDGAPSALDPQIDALWRRAVAFEANLRQGTPALVPQRPVPVPPDPTWPDQARRLSARLHYRLTPLVEGLTLHHIGATAVPGLPAPDVIDLQIGVPHLPDADRADVGGVLDRLGFPLVPQAGTDPLGHASAGDAPDPSGRLRLSCDPGRLVRLRLRAVGSPEWRRGVLLRDWLRAVPAARQEYAHAERGAGAQWTYDPGVTAWLEAIIARAEDWATATSWRFPPE